MYEMNLWTGCKVEIHDGRVRHTQPVFTARACCGILYYLPFKGIRFPRLHLICDMSVIIQFPAASAVDIYNVVKHQSKVCFAYEWSIRDFSLYSFYENLLERFHVNSPEELSIF